MNEKSSTDIKKWFWQRISKDAFLIALITWVVLFVLELVKPGLVSNYLSLQHAAIALLFLGIFTIAVMDNQKSAKLQKTPMLYALLAVISFITILFIFSLETNSWFLTLILVFASLAAIWGGTFVMIDNSDL